MNNFLRSLKLNRPQGQPPMSHMLFLPATVIFAIGSGYYLYSREKHVPTYIFWLRFNEKTFGVRNDESAWLERSLREYGEANNITGNVLMNNRNSIIALQASTLMGYVLGGVTGFLGVGPSRFFSGVFGNKWLSALYSASLYAISLRLIVPEMFLMARSGGRKGAHEADTMFMEYLQQKSIEQRMYLQQKATEKPLIQTNLTSSVEAIKTTHL